ncbi:MAG: CpaF family protein [Lachnospiraceae bacterium]|nr:CpaF family protein [Lachnospiraceae bacterium]
MSDGNSVKKELQAKLINKIDYSRDTTDEELYELIDETIINESREKHLNLVERETLRKKLFHALRKLDILQDLVDDPGVTEIMINGPDTIFIERAGSLMRYPMRFESKEKLEDVIQQIVSGCNRVVNEANPIVDARLENGSRVNIVLAPVALNGPIVTIRRFPDKPISMDDLISFGSLRKDIADKLADLVRARYNIFISGGTGSGKTTFLNALSAYIPKDERIITIEDNAELQIIDLPNLVKLETRNANVEGCREITIRDLIKSSLRMRPDRVVVGEVRGGEAFDMMQAMNTGHDGSMSTGHANSCKDMLSRLENMILMGMELPLSAIRRQIASGIDLIVHLGRLRDRSRRVLEITEIIDNGTDEIGRNVLYRFMETGVDENDRIIGELIKENELICKDKLYAAGITAW